MTNLIETVPYPPATLQDRDGHVLAKGEAYVDTKKRLAEFFPSTAENEDILQKHASLLRMTGGETYAISSIQRCPAMRLGRANPHYDMDLETSA